VGAAPLPVFRFRNQAGLHGIEVDILDRFAQMRFVADVPIPVFAVPNGRDHILAATAKEGANLSRRELFPRGRDFRDGPGFNRLEEDMHVIGHYDPCQQPITSPVKAQ